MRYKHHTQRREWIEEKSGRDEEVFTTLGVSQRVVRLFKGMNKCNEFDLLETPPALRLSPVLSLLLNEFLIPLIVVANGSNLHGNIKLHLNFEFLPFMATIVAQVQMATSPIVGLN